MCHSGATLFVRQCLEIGFQCLCRGVGINRNGSIAFIVLVSKAVIRNTKATMLTLRATNKRASQEIREVVKDSQAPPPACKQLQRSLWEMHHVSLWEY